MNRSNKARLVGVAVVALGGAVFAYGRRLSDVLGIAVFPGYTLSDVKDLGWFVAGLVALLWVGSHFYPRLHVESRDHHATTTGRSRDSGEVTSDASSFSWQEMFSYLTESGVQGSIGRPDVIVGLNDGIVPAAILARNLGCTTLAYLSLEHNGSTNAGTLTLDIAGKTVLVVDDQLYSGRTMEKAADFLVTNFGADRRS
jgi:hypothetical protein